MVDIDGMLRDFHEKFEEEQRSTGQRNQEFRRDLIEEEFREFNELIEEDGFDKNAVSEELADIVYSTWGTAVCFGIDLEGELKEIHKENMSKTSLKTPEDMKQ